MRSLEAFMKAPVQRVPSVMNPPTLHEAEEAEPINAQLSSEHEKGSAILYRVKTKVSLSV